MNSFLSPITTSMNISFSLQIVWMGGAINNISAFSIIVNLFHLLKYSLLLFFLRLSTILSKFQIHMHFKALLLPLLEGMPHRVAEDGFQRALQSPLPSPCHSSCGAVIRDRGCHDPCVLQCGILGSSPLSVGCCTFLILVPCCFPVSSRGFFLGKKC